MGENPEEACLKKIFEFLDHDQDGILNRADLEFCLTTYLNHTITEAKIKTQKLILSIDFNNNEVIEYSQFLMGAMKKEYILTDANQEDAFRVLKSGKNGLINCKSLKNILGEEINYQKFFLDRGYYEESPCASHQKEVIYIYIYIYA